MAGQGEATHPNRAPLGAHVSTAGGVERAPDRASEIGADAIQVFTSAPQRWAKTAIGVRSAKGPWITNVDSSFAACFSET